MHEEAQDFDLPSHCSSIRRATIRLLRKMLRVSHNDVCKLSSPFSSMSICLIFRLLRILMATLWPVRMCSATLTCGAFRVHQMLQEGFV